MSPPDSPKSHHSREPLAVLTFEDVCVWLVEEDTLNWEIKCFFIYLRSGSPLFSHFPKLSLEDKEREFGGENREGKSWAPVYDSGASNLRNSFWERKPH